MPLQTHCLMRSVTNLNESDISSSLFKMVSLAVGPSNANVPVPRYLRVRGLNSITNVTVVCGKGAPTPHVFNAKSGSGMPLSHPPDSIIMHA